MIPNHQQLLGILNAADPEFLAGEFDTRFTSGPTRSGEAGTFVYFQGGFWDIRMGGGPRFILAPWGSRIVQPNGSIEDDPAMHNPPRRPPWSLVLPRYSTFLGREDDDWQLDAGQALVNAGGELQAALTNLEHPSFSGTLSVDGHSYVITRVDLRHMVQTLTITRSEPVQEDVATLDAIKSTVREFSAH